MRCSLSVISVIRSFPEIAWDKSRAFSGGMQSLGISILRAPEEMLLLEVLLKPVVLLYCGENLSFFILDLVLQ